MKARFTEIPQRVVITTDGNTVYCQIALNIEEVEIEDPQTHETKIEYECDFNSFYGSSFLIDVDDVEENPEDYIDFKPEDVSEYEQRIRDIEDALAELGEIMGGE